MQRCLALLLNGCGLAEDIILILEGAAFRLDHYGVIVL